MAAVTVTAIKEIFEEAFKRYENSNNANKTEAATIPPRDPSSSVGTFVLFRLTEKSFKFGCMDIQMTNIRRQFSTYTI
jgi:hypothetical protein